MKKYIPVLVVLVLAISLGYFYYVARHRESESTLVGLGETSFSISRYAVIPKSVDDATVGALYRLFTYCTHEFMYIDAFVRHAAFVSFRPVTGLGFCLLYTSPSPRDCS